MSDLIAPTSQYAVAGLIDPDRVPPQGVAIQIQLDSASAGEELTVVLAKADGTQISQKMLPVNHNDQDITVRFSQEFFTEANGRLKVYYLLGEEGPSTALEFTVSDGFTGEHTVDLSAQTVPVFYHNGVIKLPLSLPPQMQFARPLKGATVYASSDASVATVDSGGNVSILRNGSTTITATLADGASKQYSLVVTGLIGLEMLASSATLKGAKTLCKTVGMRLPSHSDLVLFKNAYGRQLGQWLPDLPIWGEPIGADTAWTFDPHTGTITGESSTNAAKRQVAGVH